jgi:Lrp/AsnC family transcriptional regulator, leucine-responsive regulatory protein
MSRIFDEIDLRLLAQLSTNARAPLKTLAAAIGLSSPTTAERLRRLEERGTIRGYTIDVDAAQMGLPIQALVRIRPLPGRTPQVRDALKAAPEVVECDKVTGDDCFVARLFVSSMEALDEVVERLAEHATTSTAIVKTQIVSRRPALP